MLNHSYPKSMGNHQPNHSVAIASYPCATPAAIQDLVSDGIILLDRSRVVKIFRDVVDGVDFEDFTKVPVAIEGISNQGQIPYTSQNRCRGIHYSPACVPYLQWSRHTPIVYLYEALISIGREFTDSLNLGITRKDYVLEVATVLRYDRCPDVVLSESHTDVGHLTVGISSEEGLEVNLGGTWLKVPPNTVYIHTGQWLQYLLRDRGTQRVGDALHRVVGCPRERVSASTLYGPDPNYRVAGKTYTEFIRDRGEHHPT